MVLGPKLGFIAAATIAGITVVCVGLLLYKRRRQNPSIPTSDPASVARGVPDDPSTRSLLAKYEVRVVDSVEECESYLEARGALSGRVLGLDCEWRGTTFYSRGEWCEEAIEEDTVVRGADCPVALLQLAFTDGHVLLARLSQMKGIGKNLKALLNSKSVLKFGVGISNDVHRLAAGVRVNTLACVDLQYIANRCGIRSWTSLQGLASQLLGVELDKSMDIRCGDWESPLLSQDQIDYAAMDAIIALHILQALVELKLIRQNHRESRHSDLHQDPSVPLVVNTSQPLDTWLTSEGRLDTLNPLCQGVIDVTFKNKSGRAPVPTSDSQLKSTNAYSTRRSRLYHNCRLLAPDGQLLANMHKRKLEWYLDRGLGKLISEEPYVVQLLFEPSGRPGADREYYLREKENICAVCGTDQNCVRKNIVPHEYRKHFPPSLKEHLSHDILLLCVDCHLLAGVHSSVLKQQIAQECGLFENITSQKYSEDLEIRQLKNHARVLLKDTSKVPEQRLSVLRHTVASYYQVEPDNITRDMIQEAAEMDPRSFNRGYVSHAEQVVAELLALGGHDKVFEFQKRWRKYFLETMEPKFLPEFWSVDHNPQ